MIRRVLPYLLYAGAIGVGIYWSTSWFRTYASSNLDLVMFLLLIVLWLAWGITLLTSVTVKRGSRELFAVVVVWGFFLSAGTAAGYYLDAEVYRVWNRGQLDQLAEEVLADKQIQEIDIANVLLTGALINGNSYVLVRDPEDTVSGPDLRYYADVLQEEGVDKAVFDRYLREMDKLNLWSFQVLDNRVYLQNNYHGFLAHMNLGLMYFPEGKPENYSFPDLLGIPNCGLSHLDGNWYEYYVMID